MSRAVLSENRPYIPELEFCWTLTASVMPCPSFFLILIWEYSRRGIHSMLNRPLISALVPLSLAPCLSLVLINDLVIKGEPELEKEQGYG